MIRILIEKLKTLRLYFVRRSIKHDKYGTILVDEIYKSYDASPCDKCKYDNKRGTVCDWCEDNNNENEYYT